MKGDKLTISRHTEQPLASLFCRMKRRPSTDMDLFPQTNGMVLQQRLYMFPAAQRPNPTHAFDLIHIIERRAPSVAVHGAFHVSGLELAAFHYDRAGRGDGALRDVERVVFILREAEDDSYFSATGT